MTPTNLFLFIFACVSIPLYAAIVVMLIKNRHETNYKSAFFKIFISLGIIDICQTVNSYVFIRCPIFGYFTSFYGRNATGFLPKYVCFTLWYFVYGQFLANLLLAANRYTAFRYYWKTEAQIWTTRRTQLAYLLPWILPLFIAFYGWFEEAQYVPIPDLYNNTIGYSILLSQKDYMVNLIISETVMVTVTLITCTTYILAAWYFRKMADSQNYSTTRNLISLKVERRLFACALLLFISMFTFVAVQVFTFVIVMAENPSLLLALYNWYYIVVDQFTLLSPWSLLATSPSVRRGLLQMFGWKVKDVTTVTPTVMVKQGDRSEQLNR